MKDVLMIHEVTKDIFKLPLHMFTLTFDDALFSQYYYWPLIKEIPTRKIFFPSGKYMNRSCVEPRKQYPIRTIPFMTCEDARRIFDETDGIRCDQYMAPSELKMIADTVEIGGHGYAHIREYKGGLKEQVEQMENDVRLMLRWHTSLFDGRPKSYCFPFNKEPHFLREILKRWDIYDFFGQDRIPIEDLL